MDFYLGLAQIIGVHTLLGLSAYCVLLTGQVSLAQAGFFAIGAYVAGMLTVLAGWPLVPSLIVAAIAGGAIACAVGFPALRVKGLMLVVATVAFGEAVRLFFFNFTYQINAGNIMLGPHGGVRSADPAGDVAGAFPVPDADLVAGPALDRELARFEVQEQRRRRVQCPEL